MPPLSPTQSTSVVSRTHGTRCQYLLDGRVKRPQHQVSSRPSVFISRLGKSRGEGQFNPVKARQSPGRQELLRQCRLHATARKRWYQELCSTDLGKVTRLRPPISWPLTYFRLHELSYTCTASDSEVETMASLHRLLSHYILPSCCLAIQQWLLH